MNAALNLADGNVVAGNDVAKLMFTVRDCAENVTHAPLRAHKLLFLLSACICGNVLPWGATSI